MLCHLQLLLHTCDFTRCMHTLTLCPCNLAALYAFHLYACHVPVQDKSWRVRYNVAQQLTTLCEALGPDLAK